MSEDIRREYGAHLVEEVHAGRMTRRDLVRRASVIGLSASAVTGLLSACGGSSPSPGSTTTATGSVKRGGTGRAGVTTPAADVDPVTLFNVGAQVTAGIAGEFLCFPRPDYTLEPKLATSWRPSASAREWTFAIRKGVRFHDGGALAADDVVATFDRLTDPKVNSAALSAFKGILSHGSTEKVDAHTVRFHLDRPFADFPYLVCAFNYNSIILPRNYEIGSFTKGAVGTGPYILKRYTPKRGADFVRNPHYWASGLPYMDGLTLKYYDDNSAIVLALQAGAIDVMPQTPYQGSQALYADGNVRVLQNPSSEYRGLHMRVDSKPFTDQRVRQAVALCLDRRAIIKGVLGGRAQVGNDHIFAPIYPSSARVLAQVAQRQQDYAAAKRLLAEAGYPRGFHVTLTTEQFLEIPQYAQFVQQQLKPAGIDVKLNVEDQTKYYGSGDNQPWLQVPFGIVDWGARGSPSQSALPAYECGGVWNSAHWCDRQFDATMHAFDETVDEQRRLQLAVKAARIEQEATPSIIAYWINEQRALRKNVRGVAPGPTFPFDASKMWLA